MDMNIKCEECGQPATSQVEWEANGEIEKHFYCDDCYLAINPSETYGKKSKFYSEIRKVNDNINDENDFDGEISDGLDESGVPFEYSSEVESGEIPPFLLEQIGKLETILAVELFGPKRIWKSPVKSTKKVKKDIPSVYCSGCGRSFEDVMKTQRAGCAKCYQTFDSILMKKHLRFSDGKHYGGKNYKSKLFVNDIDYMQKELSTAVKNQDFERAAFLRDEMSKLQKKATI